MNWTDTRRKLMQLAASRRREPREVGQGERRPDSERAPSAPGAAATNGAANGSAAGVQRAASICVASGKGGTGKTVVTAALAQLFALRGRTLIVDADLGVGNAHILQDVVPRASFFDVVEGRAGVREIVLPCGDDVDLIAGGSGIPRLAELSKFELHLIAAGLEELEPDYRFLLVDSAAGVSSQTVAFAQACDVVLIVTTPDLTAMTDAYAFLKVLFAHRPDSRPLLLVNRARDAEEADDVTERIQRVSQRFLGGAPDGIGWLPYDPAVVESVNRRGSVVRLEPSAPVSLAMRRVAVRLLDELGRCRVRGMGHALRGEVGYPAHRGR